MPMCHKNVTTQLAIPLPNNNHILKIIFTVRLINKFVIKSALNISQFYLTKYLTAFQLTAVNGQFYKFYATM